MHFERLRSGSNSIAVALLILAPIAHVLVTQLSGSGVLPSSIFAATVVVAFLLLRVEKTSMLLFFVLLGDASYSLYLIHPYTLQLPVKLLGDQLSFEALTLLLAVTTIVTIVLSIGVFKWIEKPAQDILLGRFKPRKQSAELSASPAQR